LILKDQAGAKSGVSSMSASPENADIPASPAALGLSGKQIEVLSLLMQGKSNKAICRALDLAEPTVKYHVTTILKALKAANRTEAVLVVGKLGWKFPTLEGAKVADPTASTLAVRMPQVAVREKHAVSNTGDSVKASALEPRPALTLPEKPSIVVLPFTNMSGDPNQDYFADGMVEDITLALGRLPWLFVVGSRSAFTYKDRTVDLKHVGLELGVRYALSGSVRKEGDRVRIVVQLADTLHGGQIWGDSFQGGLEEIFEMQDRVAAQVRTMISPALRSEEIERARQKPTENLTAYDLFLRALPIHNQGLEQNREALQLLYRAIELDPGYGAAYGLAAHCYDLRKQFGWIHPSDPEISEGIRLAHLAAEKGKNDSEALRMAAHTLVLLDAELDQARSLAERAIVLNPNSPNALWVSAAAHAFLGESDAALGRSARARRLSPLEASAFTYWMPTIIAYFFAGRYEEAADAADRSLAERADYPPPLRYKIACCGLLGRIEEGRANVERLLRVYPQATVAEQRAFYGPMLRRNRDRIEEYLKGLRLSGLPEGEPSS
jgi:TolB-like protein/DNA-binding CsgD family transcriptional regulator